MDNPALVEAVPEFRRPPLAKARLVDVGLSVVFFVGVAAWATAVVLLPSDYDEVYHAHAIWLISQGDRPFHDFLAVHTPYLWYAASLPVRWLPESPAVLIPLRISSGVGIVAWLTAYAANFCVPQANLSLRWMLAGIGVVLFSHPVLAYCVEFRPDSWAFALFFIALYMLRRRGNARTSVRHYACYAFLATASTVACLKVAPFAVVFALLDLLRLTRRGPDIRAALLGHLAGVFAAISISWLFLEWVQIDFKMMFQFAYRFQVMFQDNTGFSHGLFKSLLSNPVAFLVGAAGILCWFVQSLRKRVVPDPFYVSIIAVLAWELFQVHRPYKQYYGPWLLLSAPFFGFAEPFCRLRRIRENIRLFPIVIVGIAMAAVSIGRLLQDDLGSSMHRLRNRIAAESDDGSPIIAAPPFHPIFRRDVFYAWSRTTDPRGYTTERAMGDLGFGEFISAESNRNALRRCDPAVIVLPLPKDDLYEPLQWQIISEFLRRNADRYEIVAKEEIRPLAIRRAVMK